MEDYETDPIQVVDVEVSREAYDEAVRRWEEAKAKRSDDRPEPPLGDYLLEVVGVSFSLPTDEYMQVTGE